METLIGIRTLERLDKDEFTEEERTEAEEMAEQRRIEEDDKTVCLNFSFVNYNLQFLNIRLYINLICQFHYQFKFSSIKSTSTLNNIFLETRNCLTKFFMQRAKHFLN